MGDMITVTSRPGSGPYPYPSFTGDIGRQQGIAQQDPDCHDPGDGQRQSETGATSLLPPLFQHSPCRSRRYPWLRDCSRVPPIRILITQLTVQHSLTTDPRWHIIAV